MHILILGASGQIGYPTLLHLAMAFPDSMVSGTSRSGFPVEQYSSTNLRLLSFDPFQDDWRALGRIDVLINCIGQIRESPNCSFQQIHGGITTLILQHRAQIGNPRIIQVSALGAGQHPNVPFLATKFEADQLLLAAGNSHIVRPSIVCTPDTMLARKIRLLYQISRRLFGNLLVPHGFLESMIQPVLVEDVSALIAELIRKSEETLVVPAVGPAQITFGELLELMAVQSTHPIRLRRFPRSIASFFVHRLIAPFAPYLISSDQFQLLFEDNVADSTDIERILGRKPSDTWPFWQAQLR